MHENVNVLLTESKIILLKLLYKFKLNLFCLYMLIVVARYI